MKMSSLGHICTYCGKCLKSRGGYSKHVRKHQNKAPYKCCGKSFFEREKLERHRCSTHGQPKTVKCEVCGKKFAALTAMQQHKQVVHQSPGFKCDLCGKAFKA